MSKNKKATQLELLFVKSKSNLTTRLNQKHIFIPIVNFRETVPFLVVLVLIVFNMSRENLSV
jgi:ABC-type methionine transport system permease subunit